MSTFDLPRRSVVRGVVMVLAGGVAGFVVGRQSSAAEAGGPATAANGYGPAAASEGMLLSPLDDVPVDGGVVVDDAQVVLTRDADGTVRGFSATCTHQGCAVSSVEGGQIICPCHGSKFDASTGDVTAGPATQRLGSVPVVVRDDGVYRD